MKTHNVLILAAIVSGLLAFGFAGSGYSASSDYGAAGEFSSGLLQKSAIAQIADQAIQIATNLSSTTYSHEPVTEAELPDVIIMDGHWISNTDCSGFVSFVLDQVATRRYVPIYYLKEVDQPWPRAHTYYHFFKSLPKNTTKQGWRQITDLRQALAGDILTWCENEFCTSDGVGKGDTGHVMVIDSVRAINDNTLSVRVIDSSSVIHYGNPPYLCQTGTTDAPCIAVKRNGLGLGAIHFQIDSKGAPTAFQFDASDNWHPQTGETIEFAVGRVVMK